MPLHKDFVSLLEIHLISLMLESSVNILCSFSKILQNLQVTLPNGSNVITALVSDWTAAKGVSK